MPYLVVSRSFLEEVTKFGGVCFNVKKKVLMFKVCTGSFRSPLLQSE